MRILRDAVIKERQEKESINKAKNDLTTEVDRLRIQLQEKVIFYVYKKKLKINRKLIT